MPFTPDQQQEILAEINRRFRRPLLPGTPPRVPPCPLCGETAGYALMESPVLFPVAEPPWNHTIDYSAATVPCAVLTCNNCAHTQFVALLSLGLGHLLEPRYPR
jgi:hypothetical protein